ncbi:hypothetical protein MERGE_000903 [Pneumocystis wakefieldiae]|uniref:Kinesin motor domain-containing protein n=1 Tax=Pneumocystis wakefieldiae TaxID=38082 RepID=A0A899G152_9ASCO|nr:hypothetical protein MERGE_000903 [Pneumocystis wakefieldiae]
MSSKTKYNGLFHRENKSSLSKTKYPQFDQDIYHSSFDQQYNSNSFGFSGNQNDYDIDHLSSKIKALKDITISIGDEIRESSVFLSSMNDKFSSTRVMLNVCMLLSRQSSETLRHNSVRVIVRVRPLNEREIARGAKCLVSVNTNDRQTLIVKCPDDCDPSNSRAFKRRIREFKTFSFDRCLWSVDKMDKHFSGQNALYDCLGKEFVSHSLEGYNTCIFAYGQTGSGKTYSMIGSSDDPGLMPLACKDLFEQIEERSKMDICFTVTVSYYEIYNEIAMDLLSARDVIQKPVALKVRESPVDGPYLENLSEFQVTSFDDVLAFIRVGNNARITASTRMNETSSRSHAIFTVKIKQVYLDKNEKKTVEKTSLFRLIDLAGSERAYATGSTGSRLKEGAFINKSLTSLGRVITYLSEGKSGTIIPYRDSVLTFLLSDSLGGNSKTAMVACISPSDYDESLSTLRYATAAKHIHTNAVVNEIKEIKFACNADIEKELDDMTQLLAELQAEKNELEGHKYESIKLKTIINNLKDVYETRISSLEKENEALRMHLRLAIDSIRNPIFYPKLTKSDFTVNDIEYDCIDDNVFEMFQNDIDTLKVDLHKFSRELIC